MIAKEQHADDEDDTLKVRMIFPVTEETAEEIKNYWHDQRLNSKSAAIRALVQSGLDAWRKKRKA